MYFYTVFSALDSDMSIEVTKIDPSPNIISTFYMRSDNSGCTNSDTPAKQQFVKV